MTTNPVIEAIRTRRSVRDFTDEPVPRAALERWIDAARWAPNHRLTEPWRFFVLERGCEALAKIGDMTREYAFADGANLPEPKRSRVADEARAEVAGCPAFIYVYSIPGETEEITTENYAAVCCAVQNFQLAAHSEGYAAGWSTGKVTRLPGLAEALGADPSWQTVGALYVGRPARIPRAQRQDAASIVRWL